MRSRYMWWSAAATKAPTIRIGWRGFWTELCQWQNQYYQLRCMVCNTEYHEYLRRWFYWFYHYYNSVQKPLYPSPCPDGRGFWPTSVSKSCRQLSMQTYLSICQCFDEYLHGGELVLLGVDSAGFEGLRWLFSLLSFLFWANVNMFRVFAVWITFL